VTVVDVENSDQLMTMKNMDVPMEAYGEQVWLALCM
jgi:hypothetical protein